MSGYVLVDGVGDWPEVPASSPADFHAEVVAACRAGGRLVALPVMELRGPQLVAVVAHDGARTVEVWRTAAVSGGRYPALTAVLPQAQAFEREVAEEHGLVLEGHPWPKPLRHHADLDAPGTTDPYPFFRVEGEGVHEVAVGPVHAGIIEPGHFRFQCYGEVVHHLEIQLGYQHRGAQRLLLTAPPGRRLVIVESVAGDTAIGHGLAHVTVMEKLAGLAIPPAAQALRAMALELERIANHTGNLGALCNDVGYQPGAAWYGRLRGDYLNLLVEMTGNRFGRGWLVPGGVRLGLPEGERAGFLSRLAAAAEDCERVAELVFDASAVVSRFERTGRVEAKVAAELGLVGPVGRASGLERDARCDHPEGAYRESPPAIAVREAGDVMARAEVRRAEIAPAAACVRTQAAKIAGQLASPWSSEPLRRSALAVALLEGWRGEIAHVAATDREGQLVGYQIVDPSFHNWFGLAMALRGNQISDFPLCNKSFNLSYAGHDL